MEIKGIETKRVTEQPFKGLVEDSSFVPYYATVIRYTQPRPGERAERVYSASGTGDSEYASEQAALENLRLEISREVVTAYEQYNVRMGAGNLDIA